MASVIQTSGLSRTFRGPIWRPRPVVAVEDVSIEVPAGQSVGLVGPNGAGKTTLMRLLVGLVLPDAGTVELLGEQVTTRTPRRLREVGVLIEEPRFYPYLGGRDNLRIIATLLGGGVAETIPHVLQAVGLAGRADDRVSTYSLGMRQRLGIARCLLGSPRLLVLDEPTNGLDPEAIVDTRRVLAERAHQDGTGMIVSSHQLAGMEQMCDRILFLRDGQVVEDLLLSEVQAAAGEVQLEVDQPAAAVSAIRGAPAIPGIETAAATDRDGIVVVPLQEASASVAPLTRLLVESGVGIEQVTRPRRSLEAAYLDVIGTGHGLDNPSGSGPAGPGIGGQP